MANIAITNLCPSGYDLFQDSESFLHELTEQEIAGVLGGFKFQLLWTGLCLEF